MTDVVTAHARFENTPHTEAVAHASPSCPGYLIRIGLQPGVVLELPADDTERHRTIDHLTEALESLRDPATNPGEYRYLTATEEPA